MGARFTSQFHIRGNAHGLRIALHVTAAQEADCSNYDAPMKLCDSEPANMLGDTG